jgi:hypothetical protein
MKNKMKNLLGSSLLISASILSSCSNPSSPPIPPQPNPQCVSGTAIQHAQTKGLNLNVNIYDENDDSRGGCFTVHEKAFIDKLHALKTTKGINEPVLQEIVNDHPTVGPLTVSALRDHAEGWEYDQVFTSTPFYSGRLDYF